MGRDSATVQAFTMCKTFATQNDLYLCQRDGVIFYTLVAKHDGVSQIKEWQSGLK